MQGRDTDVVLVVSDGLELQQSFDVHSFVLKWAQYFETALASQFKEGVEHRIVFEDCRTQNCGVPL